MRNKWIYEVWKRLGGRPVPMRGILQVRILWAPRDKRMADVDAYLKTALDWMALASVYADDKQIEKVTIQRLPGVEFPGWMTVEVWEAGADQR